MNFIDRFLTRCEEAKSARFLERAYRKEQEEFLSHAKELALMSVAYLSGLEEGVVLLGLLGSNNMAYECNWILCCRTKNRQLQEAAKRLAFQTLIMMDYNDPTHETKDIPALARLIFSYENE